MNSLQDSINKITSDITEQNKIVKSFIEKINNLKNIYDTMNIMNYQVCLHLQRHY